MPPFYRFGSTPMTYEAMADLARDSIWTNRHRYNIQQQQTFALPKLKYIGVQ
jgi:hypothetical protein